MQVSARVDYAVRALLVLAADADGRATRDELATAQAIPPRYLESILAQLRQGGLLVGQRGAAGGYRLGLPPDRITVADISRCVDGPLALVQGQRPERTAYAPPCEHVSELWVALRAAIRSVLDKVTLADLLAGSLPPDVATFLGQPDAWLPR